MLANTSFSITCLHAYCRRSHKLGRSTSNSVLGGDASVGSDNETEVMPVQQNTTLFAFICIMHVEVRSVIFTDSVKIMKEILNKNKIENVC